MTNEWGFVSRFPSPVLSPPSLAGVPTKNLVHFDFVDFSGVGPVYGEILQFLRDAGEGGAPDHHHADAIAAHTKISPKHVEMVYRKSVEIHSDSQVENSWRANCLILLRN